jgi:hypothetical protein
VPLLQILTVSSDANALNDEDLLTVFLGAKVQDDEMEGVKRILPALASTILSESELYVVGYTLTDILVILRSKVCLPNKYCAQLLTFISAIYGIAIWSGDCF